MIRRGDVDLINDDDTADFIVVEITRSCVETDYLASTLEKLHALTDSKERTLKYREQVAFMVLGYDDDPRELPQIDEVCQFFRAINDEWPHWLWFISRNTGLLKTLLLMLSPGAIINIRAGDFEVDLAPIMDSLKDLLSRGSTLFTAHQIPDKDIQDSLDSALLSLGLNG